MLPQMEIIFPATHDATVAQREEVDPHRKQAHRVSSCGVRGTDWGDAGVGDGDAVRWSRLEHALGPCTAGGVREECGRIML
jgi:hypothetical protein